MRLDRQEIFKRNSFDKTAGIADCQTIIIQKNSDTPHHSIITMTKCIYQSFAESSLVVVGNRDAEKTFFYFFFLVATVHIALYLLKGGKHGQHKRIIDHYACSACNLKSCFHCRNASSYAVSFTDKQHTAVCRDKLSVIHGSEP